MQEIIVGQENSAQGTVKPVRQPLMLIVLCGPSHAGKTTFANKLSKSGKNFTIISPDEIRKRMSISFGEPKHEAKVWEIYESMKCKALKEGLNIVLDACHMSERARWHALQGTNIQHRKICVVFDLPLRVVRERCLSEKRVSLKEVERMWQAFQHSKPSPEELKLQGFDAVCFMTVEGDCHDNSRQRCFIFHHLRAGLSAWPEGQWYNNKGVNYG